jgi:hypothetical protein
MFATLAGWIIAHGVEDNISYLGLVSGRMQVLRSELLSRAQCISQGKDKKTLELAKKNGIIFVEEIIPPKAGSPGKQVQVRAIAETFGAIGEKGTGRCKKVRDVKIHGESSLVKIIVDRLRPADGKVDLICSNIALDHATAIEAAHGAAANPSKAKNASKAVAEKLAATPAHLKPVGQKAFCVPLTPKEAEETGARFKVSQFEKQFRPSKLSYCMAACECKDGPGANTKKLPALKPTKGGTRRRGSVRRRFLGRRSKRLRRRTRRKARGSGRVR